MLPEKEFEDKVREFKRNLVREKLSQCTPSQRVVFGRMYHGGIDAMKEDSMRGAYGQCVRTIKKKSA
jgi:hypothetical protein